VSINKLVLKSKIKDYDIFFVDSCDFLKKYDDNCVFVVDENVWEHHSKGCLSDLDAGDVIILPIGEEKKGLESVLKLYDKMMERSAKRNMTIVSIGGGITQDITGFMASTLYRGINWVYVPTTLLAQADSCIGSKTSLNYKQYKNLIGTFYPPTEIYIYSPFLTTQQDIDFFSGVGEVVKLHLMGGEENVNKIIAELAMIADKESDALLRAVQNSLLIKQSYIEEDEFDTGRRNLLNYGHCFGHAIESATDFSIPHGQAVVLGMILANKVAKNRNLLSPDSEAFIAEKLLWPVAQIKETLDFDVDRVIEAMKQDKKRTGTELALIMMVNGYEMIKVNDLSENEAAEVLSGEKILN